MKGTMQEGAKLAVAYFSQALCCRTRLWSNYEVRAMSNLFSREYTPTRTGI